MTPIDLRKLALRLKVLEMLRIHSERQKLAAESTSLWQRLVCPN
jgi:hypothetical protein